MKSMLLLLEEALQSREEFAMDRTRKFVRQLKAEEKAAKMARDAFEL